jgi:hypothetical protein
LVAHNRIILLDHDDPKKEVKVEVYLLTSVGREVLRLASFFVDDEYLRSVAEDFSRIGLTVHIADYRQETADKGRYFNPVKIDVSQDVTKE